MEHIKSMGFMSYCALQIWGEYFCSFIRRFCENIFHKTKFNCSQNGKCKPIYHLMFLAAFISVFLPFLLVYFNIFSCIAPLLVFLPSKQGFFLLLLVQVSYLSPLLHLSFAFEPLLLYFLREVIFLVLCMFWEIFCNLVLYFRSFDWLTVSS